MKRILGILLVLVMLLGTALAEEASYPALNQAEDGKISVGFIINSLESEYNRRCHQAIQVEAAHRGWDLTISLAETDEAHVNAFRALINKGVDAIILGNMDMPALRSVIVEAREAGIGVYNCDTELVEGCISNALACNGLACVEMAYEVGNVIGWQGNYAVLTMPSLQVHNERMEPMKAVFNCYSGMTMLAEEYISFSDVALATQAYNYVKRWCEKYGDTIDVIICSCDLLASSAATALQDSFGGKSDCIVVGVDGGSDIMAYIRNDTNVKYSFAQPVELYYHSTCELIEQLQVKGLQPGSEGCSIAKWGDIIYCNGAILSKDACPAIGDSIHSVFGYYGGDPADANAWYNWTDAGGFAVIEEY